MAVDTVKLGKLRQVITENLRVEKTPGHTVTYIDVTNALSDAGARQNHTIFARRGCGKTLLLHTSARNLDASIKTVYLNCEDFKRHSFPNVLIEILDALFSELESNLTAWFGRKKQTKELIKAIRTELTNLKTAPDQEHQSVRSIDAQSHSEGAAAGLRAAVSPGGMNARLNIDSTIRSETERTYETHKVKIRDLDLLLPKLKGLIREFFAASTTTKESLNYRP